MHDLAVGTLAAQQEFQCAATELEIAVAIGCVEAEQRVASEKPGEAGTSGIGGGIISSDETRFVMESHLRLIDGDFGPFDCQVELRIGRFGP